jgi:MFS family permease
MKRETIALALLFSAMYFVQGVAEPTEGLIAQPIRSLLKSWGYSAAAIGGFGAVLSIPWMLKPLYGLLTDFVPLAGTRRRCYLICASGAATAGLFLLYVNPMPRGAVAGLLAILMIPTIGVAFSDVVVDALMVEKGQLHGLTGRLQSIQWTAMYGGSLMAGLMGGWLSQYQLQQLGFLICAVACSLTFVLAVLFVREEAVAIERQGFRAAAIELFVAAQTPSVYLAGAFLFLWSFNPFNMSVLYLYATQHLGISEKSYGFSLSMLSVGAMVGSLAYGLYCRRVAIPWLIHLAIIAGILSTLAYFAVGGPTSAAVISAVVGFTYLTGNMVQFDLAARACPPHVAGTTFALLMSVSNLSLSLSAAVGGWLYDGWSMRWGATTAFRLLVATGALSTALCWFVFPAIKRILAAGEMAE